MADQSNEWTQQQTEEEISIAKSRTRHEVRKPMRFRDYRGMCCVNKIIRMKGKAKISFRNCAENINTSPISV